MFHKLFGQKIEPDCNKFEEQHFDVGNGETMHIRDGQVYYTRKAPTIEEVRQARKLACCKCCKDQK